VQEKAAALENLEFRSRTIPAPAPESQGPRFRTISPAEAKDYIGAAVILTGRNGFERKCTLIGVSGNRLKFERRMGRGKVSFEYKAADITSLKVQLD
ncbi:MAG: hypothetical protein ACE5K9_01395, partial [Candidatus Methylomirabilales bacterium]